MSTETGEIEMEGRSTSHGLEETHEITIESAVAVKKDSTSHPLIDIQKLEKIRKNGTEQSRISPAVCIFEVPGCLKNIKRDLYVPNVVGLGPFHHHHTLPHLKEAKEEAVLRTLLKTYPDVPLDVALENLRKEVKEMKEEIKDCYQRSFFFDHDIFILDSCFLLQFLFPEQQKFDYPRGYSWGDLSKASHFEIGADLMKLENQIPLILLRRLIHLHRLSGVITLAVPCITLAMAKGLFPHIDKVEDLPFPDTALNPRHLLEYYQLLISIFVSDAVAIDVPNKVRRWWFGWFNNNTESKNDDSTWSVASAHELEKAGIELKRGHKLSFERKLCGFKGVLTIPQLTIADESEVIIKNTIAFEECLPQDDRLFTSFIGFLDCLIDKDADVEILRRANIIDNLIQSDQAIADLVNSCCVNVSLPPDLKGLKVKMKAYYRSSWRLMIKEFMDTHAAKPWLLVGTLAAIALLGLTIMQTIYGVMSYEAEK